MGKYTWEYGNKVFYTASGIGSCSKALFYDRQGITHEPIPQWLLDKFQEGIDNEQRILQLLHDHKPMWNLFTRDELVNRGFEFGEYMPDRDVDYSNQVRVRAEIGSKVVIQSHLDGVAYIWLSEHKEVGQPRIVEAKAFGDSYWEKYIRHGLAGFPIYQWQLTVQMKGAGLPALFVVGKKDEAGVVQEIKVERVDELPIPWAKVIGKVLGIEKRLESGQAPDCELPLMYPCPFYPLHDDDNYGKDEGGEVELQLLETLALEYQRHGDIAKEHNAKKRDIAQSIADFFDSETAGRVPTILTPNLKITDVKFTREGDIDAAALAKDGIDVGKYRKPGTEVRYPKVTKRAGGQREVEADPFHGLPS